ncbi:gp1.07 [Erwinia phage vB_EamP-L1]|uniref:Gp1.07 n=1 Tax=Erwinia phage vB_EamP-L1 TaxID=1051673 RepID=G0YQ49_9CAUD|nr:dGTPase inhibitor; target for F exclusion [Erwinia phage vB_EamP-L1]AEJ81476.1 gp1.07 [Erwinia phage vB_EamP-L1]
MIHYSLERQLFDRCHSGNLNTLRNAEDRWRGLDIRPVILLSERFDMGLPRMQVNVRLMDQKNNSVFFEQDFTMYPGIHHGDVFCVTVATWLNKQFNDYRTWH